MAENITVNIEELENITVNITTGSVTNTGGGMDGEYEEVDFVSTDTNTGTVDLTTSTSDKVYFDITTVLSAYRTDLHINLLGVETAGVQKQLYLQFDGVSTSQKITFDGIVDDGLTAAGVMIVGVSTLEDPGKLVLESSISFDYIVELVSMGGGRWNLTNIKSNLQPYEFVSSSSTGIQSTFELDFSKSRVYTNLFLIDHCELTLASGFDHISGKRATLVFPENVNLDKDLTLGSGITLISGDWDNRIGYSNLVELIYSATGALATISSNFLGDKTNRDLDAIPSSYSMIGISDSSVSIAQNNSINQIILNLNTGTSVVVILGTTDGGNEILRSYTLTTAKPYVLLQRPYMPVDGLTGAWTVYAEASGGTVDIYLKT